MDNGFGPLNINTMMSIVHSAALWGTDSLKINVEADVHNGLPSFSIVGLPDNAVRESRERVRSAIINSGHEFPPKRITLNLAPADIKKEGAVFDLPIAIAMLACLGVIDPEAVKGHLFVGELGLDGSLRSVNGVISAASLSKKIGMKGIVCPEANVGEALLSGAGVWAATSLEDVVRQIRQGVPARKGGTPLVPNRDTGIQEDLCEITGQAMPKRALQIAASGGHNLLMIGPPGTGKSMLAKRLPSILPPLTKEEIIECTRIYSAAGRLKTGGIIRSRPFRSPHHTISDAGLIGGGNIPTPGEVTLSHNGVLFLDELPQFSRSALEAMRQPLEDRKVTVSRVNASITFPAFFQLVSAMNPCPCGFLGHPEKECRCTPTQISRYRSRISGPLIERIDLYVWVDPVDVTSVFHPTPGPSSKEIRREVVEAKAYQNRRGFSNAGIPDRNLESICPLDTQGEKILKHAMQGFSLSMRGYKRILKVARTIADLDGGGAIREDHLAEALQYRPEMEDL